MIELTNGGLAYMYLGLEYLLFPFAVALLNDRTYLLLNISHIIILYNILKRSSL